MTGFLFCLLVSTAAAVQLKVGLYNSIPDLQKDGFKSYEDMVENGYEYGDHSVDIIANPALYSPYGNLTRYLLEEDFDLIEIDTATLKSVVPDYVMDVSQVAPIPSDTLPVAVEAVRHGNNHYGYPTLVCGNFIVGLSPAGNENNCPLRQAHNNYDLLKSVIKFCENNIITTSTYRILFGGRMNGNSGWYLPILYLDGYVDIHGKNSITAAVDDVVKNRIVDSIVCDRLQWFISQCKNPVTLENKCFQDIPNGYVTNETNIYEDIKKKKTAFLFGFSELTAQVQQDAHVVPYAAISWPLGKEDPGAMLQFTDALVVNKKLWQNATTVKKAAIRAFIDYFTGLPLRTNNALGQDLKPQRDRYLLQANKNFYKLVSHIPLYADIYWELTRAVALPALTEVDRKVMQNVLEEKCIKMQN